MRHALPDRPAARRFLTGLFVAVSVVALLSVLQVGLCPPSGSVDTGPVRLLFRKCARARGFFSIYMTLAGVLTQVLVATDRKSTRLNSSHSQISYAVFCLKKKIPLLPSTIPSGRPVSTAIDR